MRTLSIIGAGPVGIFAAIAAEARGFAVTLWEAAQPGASLHRWGSTRFFSPFAMNIPWWARAHLAKLPPDDAILTGPQFDELVLSPLAETLDVRQGRVVSVARDRLLRGEYVGNPLRGERGFRLLVDGPQGEQTVESDYVLDSSGVPILVGLGPGGLPALGERRLGAALVHHLGDLEARLPSLRERRVLVVGAGHSAAHAVALLRREEVEVVWAVRRAHSRPLPEVADDPLVERARLVRAVNDLAATPPPGLVVERRAAIGEFVKLLDERVEVRLIEGRTHRVDLVFGAVGYRPDRSLLSELGLGVDPATEGAPRLMHALASISDCLNAPKLQPADLDSGEPGFAIIGQKSYGRARTFLLQSGYQQMEQILDSWR